MEHSCSDDRLQPLHVSDFVDGIKRTIDSGREFIYNVSGSFELSRSRLYELIRAKQDDKPLQIQWSEARGMPLADNSRIKNELEWTDFRSLEEQFIHNEISFEEEKVKVKKKKNVRIPTELRRLVENLLVFVGFFAANLVCSSHGLFSQIDWLMIYVILVSLFFGIRQSALAVILASAAYLHGQNLNILEMTNFYSYAGCVLSIMEFVFLGLAVSYTVDMLKEELRDVRRELAMFREEYKELKEINEENILIKNEYEERILDSKSGLSKLYHIVSRLMVQEPDRIFMEIMQVISELMDTDTVAVYRVRENSPYLRLINALNEESAGEGRSWNITSYPDIQKAMEDGELYMGDIWNEKIAAVLPILYQEKCVAVILIKTLPYKSQTLYHVNLLKTLSLLLQESVGRALNYEELARRKHYVEGTDILKPEAFRRNIRLAKEKARKHMAKYCVLEITYGKILEESYGIVSPKLRMTDYFGVDENGRLFVLLNNTGEEDLEYLKKRLNADGVEIQVTDAFDDVMEE